MGPLRPASSTYKKIYCATNLKFKSWWFHLFVIDQIFKSNLARQWMLLWLFYFSPLEFQNVEIPTGGVWQQIFLVMSIEIFGGVEVVNGVWNCWSRHCPVWQYLQNRLSWLDKSSIKMFWWVNCRSLVYLIVLRASWLKATSAEVEGRATRTVTTWNKQREKFILKQDSNLQRLDYQPTALSLEL